MATSILNPVIIHLVINLAHFSMDFKFDLCHDFSFWKAEIGRCIPKKLLDSDFYTFPPLCNRTEFDCMDGMWRKYCPNNKDKSCWNYDQEKHFFCNDSKTCIPKRNLSYIP